MKVKWLEKDTPDNRFRFVFEDAVDHGRRRDSSFAFRDTRVDKRSDAPMDFSDGAQVQLSKLVHVRYGCK